MTAPRSGAGGAPLPAVARPARCATAGTGAFLMSGAGNRPSRSVPDPGAFLPARRFATPVTPGTGRPVAGRPPCTSAAADLADRRRAPISDA
jgi:hypothetical protein